MKKILYVIAGLAGIVLVVLIVFTFSFGFIGSNKSQFVGPTSAEEPLPEALIFDLEKYVTKAMEQYDVPGASMVLVQGDEIVYSRGLGVRDLQTKAPVSNETLFGIGSTTKTMTAIMIASLVEDGFFDWDTPVTDVLPAFALSNPRLSNEITFEHTLCMCTGVPRRMEDISVRYSEMTAEEIIESLATIPLSGAFEEKFNYSSRMVATGGFLAAMAAGGEYGNLAEAYAQLMKERILDPLEMRSSTFSVDEAVTSGDYATPYYSSISGYVEIPPDLENIFRPISPAGALWSNANDMAKYLIMLLNGGISADGRQIVSTENLAYLWEPRVAVDAQISYGLGWHAEDYHGLTIYHHPGGTVGFASEMMVIPELNIGFALLVNGLDQVKPLGMMTRYRLLEMLTGREQVYDQEIREIDRDIRIQVFTLSLVTRKKVDPDEVDPFLGAYHNDVLGEVELVLHQDDTLWIDFGEYETRIRPLAFEENQFIFYESVFLGKTMTLKTDRNGNATMTWPGDEDVYDFVK